MQEEEEQFSVPNYLEGTEIRQIKLAKKLP